MNELKHLEEFRQALTNYHLSTDALQTLAQTRLVTLLGPTAGGRNTIISELLKTNEYYFIVSDTTRQPRYNNGVLEQSGREYWFRNEEEMLADIKAGKFLEAEIIHEQQVSGTSIRELANALKESRIAIVDADIGGIQNTLQLKPEVTAVLILPPSFEEWQQRLNGRGDMPVEEVKRRLKTAVDVFSVGLEDDRLHLIVNDNYVAAAERLHAIVSGQASGEESKLATRQLCQQLLQDTRDHLTNL